MIVDKIYNTSSVTKQQLTPEKIILVFYFPTLLILQSFSSSFEDLPKLKAKNEANQEL